MSERAHDILRKVYGHQEFRGRQAEIIAYIDDYKLLMLATLIAIPLLIVFKKPDPGPSHQHTLAME